ncbi:Uncharacterized protein TCM_016063 [Theobroma cacao]|uniref:Uncharacterized protein n=1 Tax=Theobroma cacao TaxID=3641 RepID=A0A061G4Y2_THECC|nr:Uncharacterized protein TCM_016063 [Theobroma cacao]
MILLSFLLLLVCIQKRRHQGRLEYRTFIKFSISALQCTMPIKRVTISLNSSKCPVPMYEGKMIAKSCHIWMIPKLQNFQTLSDSLHAATIDPTSDICPVNCVVSFRAPLSTYCFHSVSFICSLMINQSNNSK